MFNTFSNLSHSQEIRITIVVKYKAYKNNRYCECYSNGMVLKIICLALLCQMVRKIRFRNIVRLVMIEKKRYNRFLSINYQKW